MLARAAHTLPRMAFQLVRRHAHPSVKGSRCRPTGRVPVSSRGDGLSATRRPKLASGFCSIVRSLSSATAKTATFTEMLSNTSVRQETSCAGRGDDRSNHVCHGSLRNRPRYGRAANGGQRQHSGPQRLNPHQNMPCCNDLLSASQRRFFRSDMGP